MTDSLSIRLTDACEAVLLRGHNWLPSVIGLCSTTSGRRCLRIRDLHDQSVQTLHRRSDALQPTDQTLAGLLRRLVSGQTPASSVAMARLTSSFVGGVSCSLPHGKHGQDSHDDAEADADNDFT